MTNKIKHFSHKKNELFVLETLTKNWEFWSFEETLKTLDFIQNHLIYIHTTKDVNNWIALVLFSCADSVCEILYIFVPIPHRQKGNGLYILYQLEKILSKNFGINELFLEVNIHSTQAIKLYKKFGMNLLSTRKKYYNNKDDALIFNKTLIKQEI